MLFITVHTSEKRLDEVKEFWFQVSHNLNYQKGELASLLPQP